MSLSINYIRNNNSNLKIYLHNNGDYMSEDYIEERIRKNWNNNVNNVQSKRTFENYRIAFYGFLTHISNLDKVESDQILTWEDA